MPLPKLLIPLPRILKPRTPLVQLTLVLRTSKYDPRIPPHARILDPRQTPDILEPTLVARAPPRAAYEAVPYARSLDWDLVLAHAALRLEAGEMVAWGYHY